MARVNTPGEWKARPIPHSDGDWEVFTDFLVVPNSIDTVLATVEADHGDPPLKDGEEAENRAQTEADAKLFAASKELLAALKALVKITEDSDNVGDYGVSRDDDAMIAARAAIEKAERA